MAQDGPVGTVRMLDERGSSNRKRRADPDDHVL